MPLYEYLCRGCATRFERYVKAFGDVVPCPSCASAEVEKQLSTFALASGASGGDGAAALGSRGGSCCGGGCGCH